MLVTICLGLWISCKQSHGMCMKDDACSRADRNSLLNVHAMAGKPQLIKTLFHNLLIP